MFVKSQLLRKWITLLFFVLIIMYVFSCSNTLDSSNEKEHYDLPKTFPLKIGNSWTYKRTYFNPDSNRILIDTLRIIGQFDDAFKMTYHPEKGYSIAKNDQDKLIIIGEVDFKYNRMDTTMYQTPYIWTFFNIDSGNVPKSVLKNYYYSADSIHIAIENNMEFLGKLYDVYVIRYFKKHYPLWREQIISADGLMRERLYDGKELKMERLIQSKY